MMPYLDAVAATVQRGGGGRTFMIRTAINTTIHFSICRIRTAHVVVCVRFRWSIGADGNMNEEKFVTTAYFQVF